MPMHDGFAENLRDAANTKGFWKKSPSLSPAGVPKNPDDDTSEILRGIQCGREETSRRWFDETPSMGNFTVQWRLS